MHLLRMHFLPCVLDLFIFVYTDFKDKQLMFRWGSEKTIFKKIKINLHFSCLNVLSNTFPISCFIFPNLNIETSFVLLLIYN